jgi:hypothetical protein
MTLFFPKSDLDLAFQSQDFVLKTQRQVVKDFNRSGIDFNDQFSLHVLKYEQIIMAIRSKLIEVMKFGETQLLQLLYQIDIPQAHFTTLLENPNIAGELSELILQREAYKVHLRSIF